MGEAEKVRNGGQPGTGGLFAYRTRRRSIFSSAPDTESPVRTGRPGCRSARAGRCRGKPCPDGAARQDIPGTSQKEV